MKSPKDIWFPAKRYGWGWGFPVCWQGWTVFLAYGVLLAAGAWLFSPATSPLGFGIVITVLSVVLAAVCWAKGETPRWRWGGEDDK